MVKTDNNGGLSRVQSRGGSLKSFEQGIIKFSNYKLLNQWNTFVIFYKTLLSGSKF